MASDASSGPSHRLNSWGNGKDEGKNSSKKKAKDPVEKNGKKQGKEEGSVFTAKGASFGVQSSEKEMDPENIHFDNKGLNLDLDDDGPTLPTGRKSVGEAASNITAGVTPTGVTGCSQSAQSGGTRRYSWVWKHSTIVEDFKNAQGINIGARTVCNYCTNNYTCVSKGSVGHLQRHLENKHKKFKTLRSWSQW
ncbi:hypothetical protein RHSIM_Rhsim08G0140600 [Rhododendron simsii]|uniref:BED-type domain-containing protein n=1 Tax=Rhododendron simsii TaxID=118357 RepID=A0A834GG79_RHOSS|nr:hypothetical protein RHSIM_Rhsim08G0140600 [Rhododendron simsii]